MLYPQIPAHRQIGCGGPQNNTRTDDKEYKEPEVPEIVIPNIHTAKEVGRRIAEPVRQRIKEKECDNASNKTVEDPLDHKRGPDKELRGTHKPHDLYFLARGVDGKAQRVEGDSERGED